MINIPSLTEVKQQLYKTAQRFPLPTACAVVVAVLSIMLTHDAFSNAEKDVIWPLLMTAMLGLISLSALTLIAETTHKKYRNWLMLGGVLLLGVYWWSLPTDLNDEGSLWIMRHIFLMLGSLVALSWVPFWQLTVTNKTLWRWCSQLIGSLVVTLFFATVLFLGLAAALWSIDMLFDVDIDEELYLDIWILIAALFSPLFFLSQFVPEPAKLKEPKTVSSFMTIFTKYIMTPLAAGYLVILYSYTAKILITWEWPKGVLGWLVICFLGVAIFTYFLWTPLLKPSFEKYKRIFWLLLIPQIFLLFIAIGWRISAYSWTENRYFVVALGGWLLGTTIYFLARKDAKFKWVFVALTAVIFVSQIGPLSGYNIGQISQTKRLMIQLEAAQVKQGERFEKTEIETNDDTENEIASILDYLQDRFGDDFLKSIFPDIDYTDIASYQLTENTMQQLGLDYRSKWERNNSQSTRQEYQNFSIDRQQPLNLKDYDWQVPVTQFNNANEKSKLQGYDFRLSKNDEAPAVKIYFENVLTDTIDVSAKFESLIEKTDSQSESLPPEDTAMTYESEALSVKLYLTNGWRYSAQSNSFEAEVFVRIK
jgi:hypothetical protein